MTPSRASAVLLAVLVAACPALAHHSVLRFDSARAVTLRGQVREVVWGNPHAYIAVDVVAAAGSGRWIIESESPIVLTRLGWTKESIRVGDRIWSLGAPAKDGERIMRCQFVALMEGPRLPCYPPAVSSGKGSRPHFPGAPPS